jgi:methyltransferase (TIGR00027 family)
MIEQYQPETTRLFDDPVSKELVGNFNRFLLQFAGMRSFTVQQADAAAKGIYGIQVCRTRYIDEVVQTAIPQGIDQLLILGAGYDTRPYRLPQVEKVKVFRSRSAGRTERQAGKTAKILRPPTRSRNLHPD